MNREGEIERKREKKKVVTHDIFDLYTCLNERDNVRKRIWHVRYHIYAIHDKKDKEIRKEGLFPCA